MKPFSFKKHGRGEGLRVKIYIFLCGDKSWTVAPTAGHMMLHEVKYLGHVFNVLFKPLFCFRSN
jgi:hypothetical protein